MTGKPLLLLALTICAPLVATTQENQRAEQLARILERFPGADTDKNGTLTQEEAKAFQQKRQQDLLKRFPEADTNGDGKLSSEETKAYVQKRKQQQAEAQNRKQDQLPPSHADVKYGDHELQAFDLWLPANAAGKATPLCIYIHGGGFRGGDKSRISAGIVQRFLDRGIAFASMNYRLTNGGEFPYPIPMKDAARGLQTIRARAGEWKIDPEKIACYGGSAGAGISLWLAFRDDLADANSEDPIARQSTRIVAAGTMGGQSTYDMRVFREWFGVPGLKAHEALPDFYAMKAGETAETPRVVSLAEDASAINHLSNDDPPVFMIYNRPNTKVTMSTSQGEWVHHPLLGLKLQEAMKPLGIECIVTAPGIEDDTYDDLFAFLIQKLQQE